MNNRKIILWGVMVFLFLSFTCSALEAQTVGGAVRQQDNQRMMETKMYMMSRQKTEVRQQPGDLKYMVQKFTDKVKRALEGLRSRQSNNNMVRQKAKERMDAIKEQMRMQRYRQEALQASQKDRLRNMKERMETLARQRKDLMEFHTRQ